MATIRICPGDDGRLIVTFPCTPERVERIKTIPGKWWHPAVIAELNWLATRPLEEDIREAQANTAAVLALGKIGDRRGIVALRHILTAPEWEMDDLQWGAADVLGQLVGKSFVDSEDRLEAAKEWLREHPGDAAQHMLELTV